MHPTVRRCLESAVRVLEAAGVDSPKLSAEVLLAHVLECSRFDLHLDINRLLSAEETVSFEALVERRRGGEPVAYLVGSREFYGLDFRVGPAVLIPRPETEQIVELCESWFQAEDAFVFADLGTGSGILAVTLAYLFPHARGVAVDLSPDALAVARANALEHGVADRVRFVCADFCRSLFLPGVFDLVVSNPPYVTDAEYGEVSGEVRDFEPRLALTSGQDGLGHIRRVVPRVIDMLAEGGEFLFEFGWRQGVAVEKILRQYDNELTEIAVHKDLSGHDRVAVAKKIIA
ncbi:peptide chain release factor N(5)-glutamine methyltransferase [Salidesulfovibrio onnuriiensis]|uniref:peptide chain release factor N(5)-glutamine methyltransferase n=1 Tax=Salidesulfovibrio onnuriiensis TaxID=2583823 RepID=UPI0011C77204|nr:peptide chain release factor N(5)-glutamine methyltransferase [Salidesulfovibrio onnuriiensis]